MKMISYICLCTSVIFILSACSASKFGWENGSKTDEPSTDDKPGLIEDFDPMSLEEEDIKITPVPENSDRPVNQLKSAVTDNEYNVPGSEFVQGYRVQLFASENEENANEARKKAVFKFNEQVYLDFQGAYYRLYVGDFIERKDAERLADDAQLKGFEGAWVVPARVNPNRVPQKY
jgi:cell division septation protein DedD